MKGDVKVILRFTDGENFLSFSTTNETWNAYPDDQYAMAPIKFIVVSRKDLIHIADELNFSGYNFSADLHTKPEYDTDDLQLEDELPLF